MKALLFILTLILLFINAIFSQDYSSHPLIALPGDNYDVDVLSPSEEWPGETTFICWVNEYDSIYSVYLKQVSPTICEEIIVASDSAQKSTPQIALNGNGLKIAWQAQKSNYWQIWFRNFEGDSLGSITLFSDSLANDPQITMNSARIAWIENGRVLINEYFNDLNETVIIDSSICSSPNLAQDGYYRFFNIVYEKQIEGIKKIYLAEFSDYITPEWEKTKLSDGPCTNPRLGFLDIISFQLYMDSVWTILHNGFYGNPYDTIKVQGCNLRDPIAFSYLVPTIDNSVTTYPFVAFEKDSIGTDDSDIFIKTFNYVNEDTFINVSKTSGKNYYPQITYLFHQDTAKIAIIWINERDGKREIWISESLFNPVIGDIDDISESVRSFELKQNYPNPFNPITSIEYFVIKPSRISLTIYNVLGEKIKIFDEGFKNIGTYKIQFSGQNYPSGIYYYKLTSGNFSETKSMMLIK